jgi:hypothetical protein
MPNGNGGYRHRMYALSVQEFQPDQWDTDGNLPGLQGGHARYGIGLSEV